MGNGWCFVFIFLAFCAAQPCGPTHAILNTGEGRIIIIFTRHFASFGDFPGRKGPKFVELEQ
jgi:hypothetical protein